MLKFPAGDEAKHRTASDLDSESILRPIRLTLS